MNKVEISKKYKTRHGSDVRVICTDAKDAKRPVVALVTDRDGREYVRKYTETGQYYENTGNIQDLIEVSPWDDFKVDEPVMVREYGSAEWSRRYFAGVLDGRPTTWSNGATSWSQAEQRTTTWAQCRRPTEEERQTKATLKRNITMNNKQVADTLSRRVPAQNSGKSLFGNDQNGYFTVFSYVFSYDLHFPLAVWDGDTWLINEDSTTRTTNRHRTLMRVALIGQPTFPSDTATLRRLLRL